MKWCNLCNRLYPDGADLCSSCRTPLSDLAMVGRSETVHHDLACPQCGLKLFSVRVSNESDEAIDYSVRIIKDGDGKGRVQLHFRKKPEASEVKL